MGKTCTRAILLPTIGNLPELDDYTIDPSDVVESGRDFNGTASSVSSDAAALLGDQQFEMYTEYKGKRHEDNLINERENFSINLK